MFKGVITRLEDAPFSAQVGGALVASVVQTTSFLVLSSGVGFLVQSVGPQQSEFRALFLPPSSETEEGEEGEGGEEEDTPTTLYLQTLHRLPESRCSSFPERESELDVEGVEEEGGSAEEDEYEYRQYQGEHCSLDIDEALGVLDEGHDAFCEWSLKQERNKKKKMQSNITGASANPQEEENKRRYQHIESRQELKRIILKDILFRVSRFLDKSEMGCEGGIYRSGGDHAQRTTASSTLGGNAVVTFDTQPYDELLDNITDPPQTPFPQRVDRLEAIGLQEVMTSDDQEQLQSHLRRMRRLRLRNAFYIVPWLCSNIPRRLFVIGLGLSCSFFMAKLGSQNYQLGRELEPAVKQLAQSWFCPQGGTETMDVGGGESNAAVIGRTLPTLLLKEVLKFTVAQVGRTTVEQCIRRQTAGRREFMSQQLTFALCRTRMDFYLTHTEEEVERILRYPNDLEGVDIRIQFAVHHTLQSLGRLYATYAALGSNWRPVALLIASVCVTSWISQAARRLQLNWEARRKRSKHFRLDAVERETANSGAASAFMSQLTILEHIKELKPHGAEISLATEWYRLSSNQSGGNGHDGLADSPPSTSTSTQISLLVAKVSLEMSLFVRDFKLSLENSPIYAAKAVVNLSDTLLPTAFATAIVGMASSASPNSSTTTGVALSVVLEAYRTCKDCVGDAQNLQSVAEVVMRQGHMARTLGVLLHDQSSWEQHPPLPTTEDEEKSSGLEVAAAGTATVVSIAVAGLSYAYPTRPGHLILDELSCSIPLQPPQHIVHEKGTNGRKPGSFTVITGKSGCGKSTLLMILLGLYRPLQSSAVVDLLTTPGEEGGPALIKTSLLTTPVHTLRNEVFGFVPQTVPLFNGTVYQNLLLKQRGIYQSSSCNGSSSTGGEPEPLSDAATTQQLMQQVHWACKVAGCHGFINQLPEGYHTKLGEAAANLSGGQRQRLGIARALCAGSSSNSNAMCVGRGSPTSTTSHGGGSPTSSCTAVLGVPKVLLMDEPTASLDQCTKHALLDQLEQLVAQCGVKVLMVTHDLDVIARAGHVVRL